MLARSDVVELENLQAVQLLRKYALASASLSGVSIKDLAGGLKAWSKGHPRFPVY
jgi:hypothetical protein